MTDFLDQKRKEIQGRLKELKPLVDEYHRLEGTSYGTLRVVSELKVGYARVSTHAHLI